MSTSWSEAPDVSVTFPKADVPARLPKGWSQSENCAHLAVVSPEQDLRVTFLTASARESADQIATAAWRAVDPAFDRSVVAQGEAPSTEGWDKIVQVVYNAPAAESRAVFAIVRILGNLACITLVDGSKGSLGRRMAQISEMLEAWKPTGLSAVNLSTRTPVQWGAGEARQLSEFIQAGLDKFLVPGLSMAIVQNGEVVFAQGFGVRALDRPESVTPATRFMIGSSTKPLTTLMMARLIDQGAFNWNTPVLDLLPEFALADPAMTEKLQMRHTVCACTGMPRRDADFLFRFEGISPEQRLAEMKTMRPTTGLGETFQYSNLLVAVGGYAAASALQPRNGLQTAYERAMKTLVFEPLGMTNSFLAREEACRGDFALPHAIDFDDRCAGIDLRVEGTVESVAPAGGAWSTAEDMAQYLLLELNGGETREGNSLLTAETLRSRWSGGVKINDKLGYGLGLLHSEEQGLQVLSHGGNTLGFTSDMFFLPAQNLGVVVLTNLRVANSFLAAIRQRMFEIVFGAEPKAEEMVATSVKNRLDQSARRHERIKTDAASVAWIVDLVSKYHSPQLGSAAITQNEGQFYIQFTSWGSELGTELEPNGARLLALVSPPWSGSLRFQTVPETGEIVLDSGQEKYAFSRIGNSDLP